MSLTLKELLKLYISKAFNNEADFISEFLPNGAVEVYSIHMSHEYAQVEFHASKNGLIMTKAISTDAFIDWATSQEREY